jgi:virulence-associated protein VagC
VGERIRQDVWENKSNGQKLVTIPHDSDIEAGDPVDIFPAGDARTLYPDEKLVKKVAERVKRDLNHDDSEEG